MKSNVPISIRAIRQPQGAAHVSNDVSDTLRPEVLESPEDPNRPDITPIGAFAMNDDAQKPQEPEPSLQDILGRGGFNVVGPEGVSIVPTAHPTPEVKDPAIDLDKRVAMFGQSVTKTVGEHLFSPKVLLPPTIKLTEIEELQHRIAQMETSWTDPKILKATIADAHQTGAEAVGDWIQTLKNPSLQDVLDGIQAGAWRSQLVLEQIPHYTPSAFCKRSQHQTNPSACEKRLEPNTTNAACAKDVAKCARCGFPILHEKKP